MRIMKRLGRRLRRFFRPVTELIKRLVHSMVGSRLQSARKELARMKEGVAIAGQRVNTARQKGVGACLAECAKVTGKSVVRHRRMLLGAVNILAVSYTHLTKIQWNRKTPLVSLVPKR